MGIPGFSLQFFLDYHMPERLILFVHALIALWVRYHYCGQARRSGGKLGRQSEGLSLVLLYLGSAFTYIFTTLYIFAPNLIAVGNYAMDVASITIGTVLLCVHVVVLYATHRELGLLWSGYLELTQNHRLLDTGIYRHIRHPMYSSVICWILGLQFLTLNYFFLPSLLMIASLLLRVGKEERMMEDAFGDAYLQYKKRTGMFFFRFG